MTGRRITLLGLASYEFASDEQHRDHPEVWTVNEGHRNMPEGMKPSRVFQLHPRNWREAEREYLNGGTLPDGLDPDCFGRDNEHVEYLRTCGVWVYGQKRWPDIPTCIEYPFEEVRQAVGIPIPPRWEKRLWATSSFGYMAALLLTEHLVVGATVESVLLSGISLPVGTSRERVWEWPNFAHYLGLMTGVGIRVVLPDLGSVLLSAPHYAIDGHPIPGDPDHWFYPSRGVVIMGPDGYSFGRWKEPDSIDEAAKDEAKA